jgi:hypothetical protein
MFRDTQSSLSGSAMRSATEELMLTTVGRGVNETEYREEGPYLLSEYHLKPSAQKVATVFCSAFHIFRGMYGI